MKEIIFNRKDYKVYEDFYVQIYKDLDGANMIDWEELPNLCYSADNLNEFLWYCHKDNNKYIFKNFDLEKIRNNKNYDDYMYSIILRVFERFVKNYPNNTLEFVNDEEN